MAEAAWLSTLGYLRSGRLGGDPGAIARELWNKDRLNPLTVRPYNISEYRAVTYRAADAYRLAGEMQQNPDVASDPGDFPTDPSIRPGDGQYSYRVVVEVTDAGHVVADGAVTVYSNMPLTAGEIHDLAVETILSDQAERDYRNTIGAAINMQRTVNAYVIAAGRA